MRSSSTWCYSLVCSRNSLLIPVIYKYLRFTFSLLCSISLNYYFKSSATQVACSTIPNTLATPRIECSSAATAVGAIASHIVSVPFVGASGSRQIPRCLVETTGYRLDHIETMLLWCGGCKVFNNFNLADLQDQSLGLAFLINQHSWYGPGQAC